MLKISNILCGGLGNYLFQISAGYALALRHNKKYIPSTFRIQTGHKIISSYYNNILRNLSFIEDPITNLAYKEIKFNYTEIPNFNQDMILFGYFQSEKYFKDFEKEIKNLFSISSTDETYLFSKYKDFKNSCSISIRRGDYLKNSDYHTNLSIEFYKKAIDMLDKNLNYFIISDDIDWCKQNFKFLKNITFVEGNKDYQDLYLISKCEHNIIANSTFSWWGAYLNNNPNKIVICPSKWFGDKFTEDFNDVFVESWIKL